MIEGKPVLLICIPMLLFGDMPVSKGMGGCSQSLNSTCYVPLPCRICDIAMENIVKAAIDPALCGEPRLLSTMMEFYRMNGNKIGVPDNALLRARMRSLGLVKIPVFVQLHNLPSPERLCVDVMHCVFLGVAVEHFMWTVKLLLAGHPDKQRIKRTFWRRLSEEFKQYCHDNSISAATSFRSKGEFKLRMNAASMKELMRVSPFIFIKLGLISSTPGNESSAYARKKFDKRALAFQFWCVHCRIASIVEQHSISVADVKDLDAMVCSLLEYFAVHLPKSFFTMNVHSYCHIPAQISACGPTRLATNMARESLIRVLKPYYQNTNNKRKESSVLSGHVTSRFFSVMNYLADTDASSAAKYCRYVVS